MLLTNIVPLVLDLCRAHQKGRGTKEVPDGTFDFSEGWFTRADYEALDLLDKVTTAQHGGDRKSEDVIKSDNVMLDDRGNTNTYALRKLRKDAPDLFTIPHFSTSPRRGAEVSHGPGQTPGGFC